nr:MAG TPA: hypothetical protein [Caudoviricetes sp.]
MLFSLIYRILNTYSFKVSFCFFLFNIYSR